MTEFYQWAADNFIAFLGITAVLVMAIGTLIEVWRDK